MRSVAPVTLAVSSRRNPPASWGGFLGARSVRPHDTVRRMILVVDHYDSFTFNLVQLIESLGRETRVVKSDERPAAELLAMHPEAVVLSPGPGHPRDVGVFTELLTQLPAETPVLGVCLGHQALGIGSGGTVDRTEPVHGKASLVFHEGRGILAGLPVPFEAGRYHSLVVEPALPAALELTAWTEDGLVMGAQHRELPRYGVQFHPESILTPEGPRIVENFLGLRS
jgi:anthranilate synthase component II